nr:hypothetical protein BaRGS_007370 [Batillaria attramentaria]
MESREVVVVGGIESARVTLVTYGLLSCKSSATVKEALLAQNFNFVICDESHYFKNSRTDGASNLEELQHRLQSLMIRREKDSVLTQLPPKQRQKILFQLKDSQTKKKKHSDALLMLTKIGEVEVHVSPHRSLNSSKGVVRDEALAYLSDEELAAGVDMDTVEESLFPSSPPWTLPPPEVMLDLTQYRKDQTPDPIYIHGLQQVLASFPGYCQIYTDGSKSEDGREILTQFAELKPMLKKSNTSLATALMGRENKTGSGNNAASSNSTGEQQEISILSRIQRLYKLAAEAKIGPAREYVQMLCENANLKFLVFAYHHCMMDGIQQTLWDKKVKFVRIDGSTKPSDRQGLTLTAAKLVVFAELYWTPGVMVQCEDRAHRIGQSSALPVHYLVARDTMDEWTLVTSAALSGKTRALQADAGSSYQVDLLSAADEYKPSDNSDIDISAFLQSQL